MKTSCFVFVAPHQVDWQESEIAESPGEGEILLQVHAAVISAGTDVSIYNGTHRNILNPAAPWPKYPHCPGGHLAGTVLKVGKGVSGFAEGDRVTFGGRYTDYAVVSVGAAPVRHIPEGVSFADAALARHSTVSLHGIRNGRVVLGDNVAVFGLGLIGQYTAQYARLAGADKLVGVDLHEGRRKIALDLAVDLVLDPRSADLEAEIASSTGGQGADVVVEASGNPEAITSAMRAARQFGRVVLLGSTRGNVEFDLYNDLHRKGLTVIGSNPQPLAATPQNPWTMANNLTFALNLVASARLQLEPLISHHLPAPESLGIWAELAARPHEFLGVVLEW